MRILCSEPACPCPLLLRFPILLSATLLGLLVESQATVSLYVTTSYFVPPGFLRRALQAALARDGVDVFLLLSGDSDVWGDVYATTYVVRKFLVSE